MDSDRITEIQDIVGKVPCVICTRNSEWVGEFILQSQKTNKKKDKQSDKNYSSTTIYVITTLTLKFMVELKLIL